MEQNTEHNYANAENTEMNTTVPQRIDSSNQFQQTFLMSGEENSVGYVPNPPVQHEITGQDTVTIQEFIVSEHQAMDQPAAHNMVEVTSQAVPEVQPFTVSQHDTNSHSVCSETFVQSVPDHDQTYENIEESRVQQSRSTGSDCMQPFIEGGQSQGDIVNVQNRLLVSHAAHTVKEQSSEEGVEAAMVLDCTDTLREHVDSLANVVTQGTPHTRSNAAETQAKADDQSNAINQTSRYEHLPLPGGEDENSRVLYLQHQPSEYQQNSVGTNFSVFQEDYSQQYAIQKNQYVQIIQVKSDECGGEVQQNYDSYPVEVVLQQPNLEHISLHHTGGESEEQSGVELSVDGMHQTVQILRHPTSSYTEDQPVESHSDDRQEGKGTEEYTIEISMIKKNQQDIGNHSKSETSYPTPEVNAAGISETMLNKTSPEIHPSEMLTDILDEAPQIRHFCRNSEGLAFLDQRKDELFLGGDEKQNLCISYTLETTKARTDLYFVKFVKLDSYSLDVPGFHDKMTELEAISLCEGVDEEHILPLIDFNKHISIFVIEKTRASFRYRTRQCRSVTETGRLCEPCRQVFRDLFSLPVGSHVKYKSESEADAETITPDYPCNHCSKVFASERLLDKHLKTLNKTVTTRLTKKCLYCDEEFQMRSNKEMSHRFIHHMKTVHAKHAGDSAFRDIVEAHEKKLLKCWDCMKTFANNRSLEAHQRVAHTTPPDSEKYSCHICGKSFKTNSTLYGHIKTHEDGKFICPVCGANFKVRSYLQRHLQSHDQNKKKFECDICQKKFSQPYLVRQHKEFSHLKNLPHKCEECGKMTRSLTRLKIHIRAVHSKEKPFPCEICGFKCSRMDNLNIHRTKVHGMKTKLTRRDLLNLVKNGQHQFCKDPNLIPNY